MKTNADSEDMEKKKKKKRGARGKEKRETRRIDDDKGHDDPRRSVEAHIDLTILEADAIHHVNSPLSVPLGVEAHNCGTTSLHVGVPHAPCIKNQRRTSNWTACCEEQLPGSDHAGSASCSPWEDFAP